MKVNRREAILAGLAASLPLTSSNFGSALRFAIHGNRQLPAVAAYIPGQDFPAAVIEMPEHAWHKQFTAENPVWLYNRNAGDPQVRGEVQWSEEPRKLAYTMQTASGFTLKSEAQLLPDGIAVSHTILGPVGVPARIFQAPTCVKLYRPFTDVFLERMYVHHTDGLDLVASETPERLQQNAEEWLPCRYIVLCNKSGQAPKQATDHQDGVKRYFKSRPADTAFIAAESNPPGWVAAVHSSSCPSMFTNPARTCLHADPETRVLDANAAKIDLRIYFLRGNVEDAWNVAAQT